MLGRMFGHEFRALLIFQKFLITDDFAALFGFPSRVMDYFVRVVCVESVHDILKGSVSVVYRLYIG